MNNKFDDITLRQFLNSGYWREIFQVDERCLAWLEDYLEQKGGNLSAEDLAIFLVSKIIEHEVKTPEFEGARMYSPRNKYRVGQKIFFFYSVDGPCFGEVIHVHKGRTPYSKGGSWVGIKVRFSQDKTEQVYVSCCDEFYARLSIEAKRKYLTPESIVYENEKSILPKIERALQKDERFSRRAPAEPDGPSEWVVTPPKEVVNTLTEEQIAEGYIKVTSGLKRMLHFYRIGHEVTFVLYGYYEIKTCLDQNWKRIYGNKIREYYEANNLREGDKLYIQAPDVPNGHLRIYTEHEKRKSESPCGLSKSERKNLGLRHHIFEVLLKEHKFLHHKIIKEKVSALIAEEVKLSSVNATLSQNKHLFTRMERTRGIWGLTEWEEIRPEVDLNSLHLAMGEEDWVYRILKDRGDFMSTREIAQSIGEKFGIKKEKVLEITFINPKDNRLVQNINDLWGLQQWIDEWERRLREIESKINEVQELKASQQSMEEKLKGIEVERSKLTGEMRRLQHIKANLQQSIAQLTQQLNSLEGLERLGDERMTAKKRDKIRATIKKVAQFLRTIFKMLFYRKEIKRLHNMKEQLKKGVMEERIKLNKVESEIKKVEEKIVQAESTVLFLKKNIKTIKDKLSCYNEEELLKEKSDVIARLGKCGGVK